MGSRFPRRVCALLAGATPDPWPELIAYLGRAAGSDVALAYVAGRPPSRLAGFGVFAADLGESPHPEALALALDRAGFAGRLVRAFGPDGGEPAGFPAFASRRPQGLRRRLRLLLDAAGPPLA